MPAPQLTVVAPDPGQPPAPTRAPGPRDELAPEAPVFAPDPEPQGDASRVTWPPTARLASLEAAHADLASALDAERRAHDLARQMLHERHAEIEALRARVAELEAVAAEPPAEIEAPAEPARRRKG